MALVLREGTRRPPFFDAPSGSILGTAMVQDAQYRLRAGTCSVPEVLMHDPRSCVSD